MRSDKEPLVVSPDSDITQVKAIHITPKLYSPAPGPTILRSSPQSFPLASARRPTQTRQRIHAINKES